MKVYLNMSVFSLPTHCSHRFLYYNVQCLLGVIFDLVSIIFFLTDCSNFCSCLLRGMGKFPSASIVYYLHSSCVHNTSSLLGVNLRLNFCFLLDCLARLFFIFDVRGHRGSTPVKLCIEAFNFEKL
jgi:hypothetical protein